MRSYSSPTWPTKAVPVKLEWDQVISPSHTGQTSPSAKHMSSPVSTLQSQASIALSAEVAPRSPAAHQRHNCRAAAQHRTPLLSYRQSPPPPCRSAAVGFPRTEHPRAPACAAWGACADARFCRVPLPLTPLASALCTAATLAAACSQLGPARHGASRAPPAFPGPPCSSGRCTRHLVAACIATLFIMLCSSFSCFQRVVPGSRLAQTRMRVHSQRERFMLNIMV